MERGKIEILTYVLAILAGNGAFLYARHLDPKNTTITLFHIFFAVMQLVHILPKLIALSKSK